MTPILRLWRLWRYWLNLTIAYGPVRTWLRDQWAIIRGRCNQRIREGGYDHWRCQEPYGHLDEHRFINYVWDFGPARYEPR